MGEPLPEAGPGHQIEMLKNVAFNQVGGYVVGVETDDGSAQYPIPGNLNHFWGNPTGGPGTTLHTERQVGSWYQTYFSWACNIGISDAGVLAYSGWSEYQPNGTARLETIWNDDQVLAIEDHIHPPLAQYWRFNHQPTITADGVPHWYGLLSIDRGGAVTSGGLFEGTAGNPILFSGDLLPNVPLPLRTIDPVVHLTRFSAHGSHYITYVFLQGIPTDVGRVLVMDGEGVVLDGLLARTGYPLPPSLGLPPGSTWLDFMSYEVLENGDWFLHAQMDTIPPFGEEGGCSALFRNGEIICRPGDRFDGFVYLGHNYTAVNEDGDIALAGSLMYDGEQRYALFLNRYIILRELDQVDWDGDGLPDGAVFIRQTWDRHRFALSNRDQTGHVRLLIVARVDVNGTYNNEMDDVDCLLTMDLDARATGVSPIAPPPARAALGLAVPNPFPVGTTIPVALAREGSTALRVFDIGGHLVRVLVDRRLGAGEHVIPWDGRDMNGRRVSSGVYFLRLEAPGRLETRKVVRQ